MKLIGLFLLLMLAVSCRAQDITVHVVETATQQPIKGVNIVLPSGCIDPGRVKILLQKTSSAGTAVFHNVSLCDQPSSVLVRSISYDSLDSYVLTSLEGAKSLSKSPYPVLTALPAEVTFHVRRRTFAERLHYIFQWD